MLWCQSSRFRFTDFSPRLPSSVPLPCWFSPFLASTTTTTRRMVTAATSESDSNWWNIVPYVPFCLFIIWETSAWHSDMFCRDWMGKDSEDSEDEWDDCSKVYICCHSSHAFFPTNMHKDLQPCRLCPLATDIRPYSHPGYLSIYRQPQVQTGQEHYVPLLHKI